MIIETCGNEGQVVKVFAALNIDMNALKRGLGILEKALKTIEAECARRASGNTSNTLVKA